MDDKICFLDYDQAVSLLPDGDDIHVFMNPHGVLLGADWERSKVIEMIKAGKCQLGGKLCQGMNHGLVCESAGSLHFVATRPQDQWSANLQPTTQQGTPAGEDDKQSDRPASVA